MTPFFVRIAHIAFIGLAVMQSSLVAQDSTGANAQLDRLFEKYYEQYLILFPIEATNFGDKRYNDLLQIDIGEDFIAKKRQFYQETIAELDAIEVSTADDLHRLLGEILKYELDTRLSGLAFGFERIPFNQFDGLPLTLAQFGSGAGSQPFKTVADYENWLKRLDGFQIWANVAIDRFRQGMAEKYVLPRILVTRMIDQLLDETIVAAAPEKSIFYGPIDKLPETFSTVERTRLTAAYRKAISDQVIPTYRKLGEFLRDEYLPATRDSSGIGELADGRKQYEYWVKYWTTTELTPDEIYQIGEREVARIELEMEAVKERLQFQGSLTEMFQFLRTDPQFKPFKSADEVLSFFYQIQGKLEPRLASSFRNKPATPFEIRRTEAFREKTASAEYMPGSADGTRPGIFYCPIPEPTEFNITSGMESLFLHEALPGHHYQISLQQENQALPDFAKMLWYGAYGEGWALYCESLGEEFGLYSDPRQKIGALSDEMHRALRLVIDVGLHWKGWTREEAISYMMAHEPISEDGAVAEVERYMAYTAQALSYKIGQLRILELRRECEQRLGDRFSLPAFHSQILDSGSMPISLLERRLRVWDGE